MVTVELWWWGYLPDCNNKPLTKPAAVDALPSLAWMRKWRVFWRSYRRTSNSFFDSDPLYDSCDKAAGALPSSFWRLLPETPLTPADPHPVLPLPSGELNPELPLPTFRRAPSSGLEDRLVFEAGASDEAIGRSASPVHAPLRHPGCRRRDRFQVGAIRSWPQNLRLPTGKVKPRKRTRLLSF